MTNFLVEKRSSWKKVLIVFYAVALVGSYLFQLFASDEVFVPLAHDRFVDKVDKRPIVVLLHDSTKTASSLAGIREVLKGDGRYDVYVPELPYSRKTGTGGTSPNPWTQALKLTEVVRFAGIFQENELPPPVHVVGFGYGGPIALSVVEFTPLPELVQLRSITLVSSSVSPKFELLGNSSLNRALKTFQYVVVALAEFLVPHYGYWDDLGFNPRFADTELETDLSKIETLFEDVAFPLMVVAGESDGDMLEAYRRIQPSGSYVTYSEEAFGADLLAFISSVDAGARISTGGSGVRFEDIEGSSLNAWVAGVLLAVATFASEDLACIGGGLLAARGATTLFVATMGCLWGIFIGDFFIYLIGRTFGVTALKLPLFKRFGDEAKLDRYSQWFEKKGVSLIILTRFLPGSRVPTYFAAGVLKIGVARFALALFVASVVWTPILVGLSYFAGERFVALFESLGAYSWLGIAAFVVFFLVFFRTIAGAMTWRGRRLLYSKYKRLVRWEFWPIWALYLPVGFYIGWLMLRHRSVTLPSAVNPCMPASGLVYESKSQILGHLAKFDAPVARFEVIDFEKPARERLSQMEAFMERLSLGFPIVLKPDVGQRGQGVLIAKSLEDAKLFFAEQVEDTIVQEFVSGVEYGVFYHRFAGHSEGVISSITDKRLISVTGDGEATLETLILRDARAVCMAAFFLKEFEESLDVVVEQGVGYSLTSVGTHCRGALFLDGEELKTEEMIRVVDAFSSPIEGFHFGRYDLRAPSEEAFKRGEGLKIIELNGLTSEPTSMYDPKHSVFFAWSALMRQWKLIFELAKENRLAGHEPDSVKSILKLTVGFLRGSPSRDLS